MKQTIKIKHLLTYITTIFSAVFIQRKTSPIDDNSKSKSGLDPPPMMTFS